MDCVDYSDEPTCADEATLRAKAADAGLTAWMDVRTPLYGQANWRITAYVRRDGKPAMRVGLAEGDDFARVSADVLAQALRSRELSRAAH